MSVYTSVNAEELRAWLAAYAVGELVDMQGIAAGIENTNYFVTTTAGRYVLTLFEKLQPHELPFYLGLMTHLAHRGIPCPEPIADRSGGMLAQLKGKPATLVTRLAGADIEAPDPGHCALVGAMLARMHLAARDFTETMPNPRGLAWWRGAALEVLPHLSPAEAALLEQELEFQASNRLDGLPRGAIHADLFRDNVLFDADSIGGIIDFYFACTDALLYDLAITVNDWCIGSGGKLDRARAASMLAAYRSLRPLTQDECAAWPVALRAGALRFWVSRLFDFHCPRPGELTFAKDPEHFRRLLEAHIESPAAA
jgi:homoserine kinase type II